MGYFLPIIFISFCIVIQPDFHLLRGEGDQQILLNCRKQPQEKVGSGNSAVLDTIQWCAFVYPLKIEWDVQKKTYLGTVIYIYTCIQCIVTYWFIKA